jgi:hypothetical protein
VNRLLWFAGLDKVFLGLLEFAVIFKSEGVFVMDFVYFCWLS